MSFLSGIFGGNQVEAPKINYTPSGFAGGGLTGTFANNNFSVGADPTRQAAVGGVQSTFGQQAGALGDLRSLWTPGSSALRSSLMTALQNNRSQAIGNLRDNLAQRRVLGSSFAQNSLANADQTYQQQIEHAQAQTFLTELSAQQQLIQQQYGAARGAFQAGLDEMNLEGGMAADLTSKISSSLANIAQMQGKLDMDAAIANQKVNQDNLSGFGKLLGGIGGSIFGPLGSAIGSSLAGAVFGGGGGGAAP